MPRANSNFHLVMNSNITINQLRARGDGAEGRAYRLAFVNKLKEAAEYIRDNIVDYCKDYSETPKLINHNMNIEIGKARGFLHLDGMLRFDCYTKLDFKKITTTYNEILKDFTLNCYINVRYIHDSIKYSQEYSKKDNIQLI